MSNMDVDPNDEALKEDEIQYDSVGMTKEELEEK